MQVSITGRHIEITDAMRNHVEKRLGHVKRYFDGLLDAQVVLTVERHRHVAEMTLYANSICMHGHEATGDMYTSVDKVVEKIERQLRRYKGKLQSHRQARKGKAEELPTLSVRLDVLDSEDVESSVEHPRVIRSQRFHIKPMSLDEAVMQMDLLQQDFLVYREAQQNRINVIYRRPDGNYGLIDPEG